MPPRDDWKDGLSLLRKTAARALKLLKESDDPEQEMLWANVRLEEANLLSLNPPKDPERWTEQVIAQNPDLMDQSLPWLKERGIEPQKAETFENLILSLVPTESGL